MYSLAQSITQHFGGDWHGNYGTFPTPGHSTRDRGMSIEDKPDAPDGVLINTFNGGDPLAVKDECRRLGLLPERSNPAAPRQADRWREAGIYDYAAADGEVIYRTVRLERPGQPKRFVAKRRDGHGGWLDGIGDIERVPYRLPELLAANPAEPIYFVEGERKADKLAGWGLAATAIAFGCKGWRDSYAPHFAGRSVIILPDNDHVGREFASKVRSGLSGVAKSVAVIILPGLPEKGDVIDWTGTADDLRALSAGVAEPGAETFHFADLMAWASTSATPTSFLMAGYVPARELILATGAGGANKSTFGQQLCTCVAAGLPMLGVDVQPGSALYVTAEDGPDRLHWVQEHICGALGVSMASLAGKLHLVSLRGRLGNELATFDGEGKLRAAPSFAVLRATIKAAGASLVVLDNAAHLFAGNENDRGQVTAFVNLLYSLCLELGATVLLVGHANKAGDSYSGSTAWLNAVRSQIVLERPADGFDPDGRVLRLGKANYARQGETLEFRWHDFALVRDADLPADIRSEIAANAQANAENDAFMRCLAAATVARRAVSHIPGSNFAPKVFAGMPEGKTFNQAAYQRAFERLLHLGKIKLDQPLWQDAHRHWKQGIKTAEACGDPPAATPCGDLRRTPAQVIENTAATVRAATPLYTTYNGAAPEAAAPSVAEGTASA